MRLHESCHHRRSLVTMVLIIMFVIMQSHNPVLSLLQSVLYGTVAINLMVSPLTIIWQRDLMLL